ncbi:hypothetical protein HYO62_05110 [Aerococcaceae bacterium DSM 111022]|nr:hypothetical protein [Aerococcaceae bacterium DSM 111022]
MSESTKMYYAILITVVVVLSILFLTGVLPSNMNTALIILVVFPFFRRFLARSIAEKYNSK